MEPEKFPPDRQLEERTVSALNETRLFRYLSRRLLIDVIERRGLTTVSTGPEAVQHDPAVLVVLERPIVVSRRGAARKGAAGVVLQPGTYLRYEAPLVHVEWAKASLEAVDEPTARVFVLEMSDLSALPPMVVNALDRGELDRLGNLEPHRPRAR
jgi:hypothetical protein